MPFHWPVSYCFSEHTCRPSHTTQPWCAFGCTVHQPKHIKHDRYLSHGRARPNARGINAHTWLPGAPDVRRQPQPIDSAAGGARVRQALDRPHDARNRRPQTSRSAAKMRHELAPRTELRGATRPIRICAQG